jgi:hypothetical protein
MRMGDIFTRSVCAVFLHAVVIPVGGDDLAAEFGIRRTRVTPVACWMTLYGYRGDGSFSLAAACRSINFGPQASGSPPSNIAG